MDVPEGFADCVIPGLKLMISQLQQQSPQHPLIHRLQCVDWLVTVWCQVGCCLLLLVLAYVLVFVRVDLKHISVQDLPLKLIKWKADYYQHFKSEIDRIVQLPAWEAFQKAVILGDAKARYDAVGNRYYQSNLAGFLVELHRLSNSVREVVPVAAVEPVSPGVPVVAVSGKRKRQVTFVVFNLFGLERFEQALALYRCVFALNMLLLQVLQECQLLLLTYSNF